MRMNWAKIVGHKFKLINVGFLKKVPLLIATVAIIIFRSIDRVQYTF